MCVRRPAMLALSKAGREVSIRSDLIANSNTSDKHSGMRSLIARRNLQSKGSRGGETEGKSVGEEGERARPAKVIH